MPRKHNYKKPHPGRHYAGRISDTSGRIKDVLCLKCLNLAHRLDRPCPKCGLTPQEEKVNPKESGSTNFLGEGWD